MLALLLIILGTVLGLFVSTFFMDEESSWLTYYVGGIAGLLVSSVILEINNMRRHRREMEKERKKQKIEF